MCVLGCYVYMFVCMYVCAGGTFTLLSNSGGRLVANFSFPNIGGNFNNTPIICRDGDQRTNEVSFNLAGEGEGRGEPAYVEG